MMRSRPGRASALVLLVWLVTLLSACGDDGTTFPNPAELPGVWEAIESEFVQVAPPRQRVDLVALGGSVVLVLWPDRTFTLALTGPDAHAPWEREGVWIPDEDVLRLEYQEGGTGVNEFDMDWRDGVLRLRGGDSLYQFDVDAPPEPAKWNLRLQRISP